MELLGTHTRKTLAEIDQKVLSIKGPPAIRPSWKAKGAQAEVTVDVKTARGTNDTNNSLCAETEANDDGGDSSGGKGSSAMGPDPQQSSPDAVYSIVVG